MNRKLWPSQLRMTLLTWVYLHTWEIYITLFFSESEMVVIFQDKGRIELDPNNLILLFFKLVLIETGANGLRSLLRSLFTFHPDMGLIEQKYKLLFPLPI